MEEHLTRRTKESKVEGKISGGMQSSRCLGGVSEACSGEMLS